MSTHSARDYTQDLPNGMSPLRLKGPESQATILYAHAKANSKPNQSILDHLVAQEELAMAETSMNLAAIPDSMLSGLLPIPKTDDTYHPSKFSHVNRGKLNH